MGGVNTSGVEMRNDKTVIHQSVTSAMGLPSWVPSEAQRYIAHTEGGLSIRELARKGACAPSTVMRQVRKMEQRRDDPLIDEALDNLRASSSASGRNTKGAQAGNAKGLSPMNKIGDSDGIAPQGGGLCDADEPKLARETQHVLRRLAEKGACLAVALDMDKAVVVRDLPDGRTSRTAVLDRDVAQVLALKGWIEPTVKGKITRYAITAAGRTALREMLAEAESRRAGFHEAPVSFEGARPAWRDAEIDEPRGGKQVRYQAAESPVMVLARRREKSGEMFLSSDLVGAAERLREDYELSGLAENGQLDWDGYLAGQQRDAIAGDVNGFGAEAARARVAAALDDLGPGLGDVALRCACRLEGMESAEQELGWSARSGKIVLRIALERLKRHYDRAGYSNLIG